MRQKRVRITTLFLLIMIISNMVLVANAATPTTDSVQASYYYASTECSTFAVDSGKVTVEVEVVATHKMSSLGTKKIQIWEKKAGASSYTLVKTYSGNMLESNTMYAFATKTYQGVSGAKYYAVATLYAQDSNGSRTMYHTSNTITA